MSNSTIYGIKGDKSLVGIGKVSIQHVEGTSGLRAETTDSNQQIYFAQLEIPYSVFKGTLAQATQFINEHIFNIVHLAVEHSDDYSNRLALPIVYYFVSHIGSGSNYKLCIDVAFAAVNGVSVDGYRAKMAVNILGIANN